MAANRSSRTTELAIVEPAATGSRERVLEIILIPKTRFQNFIKLWVQFLYSKSGPVFNPENGVHAAFQKMVHIFIFNNNTSHWTDIF